jgi:hypothetical protein
LPSLQAVLVEVGVWVHCPLASQASFVHGLPSSQFWHALPLLPHSDTDPPAAQVPPDMQPLQQEPPKHLPEPLAQLVPSDTGG